jgi:hypothetical protein
MQCSPKYETPLQRNYRSFVPHDDESGAPLCRFYVFMDDHGTLGITIWKDNNNLKKIDITSIGKLCEVSKVTLSNHQGKEVLNLSKESEVSNMKMLNFT